MEIHAVSIDKPDTTRVGVNAPQMPQMDPFGEEMLRRFFGENFGNMTPMPVPQRRQAS